MLLYTAGAMIASTNSPRVAVLMVDTRSPTAVAEEAVHANWTFGSAGGALERTVPFFLTYFINSQFAARHGYELFFYQLKQSGCLHPRWGARHASYCKLTAVADAVSTGRFDLVVYLDSDAFWEETALDLPTMLSSYGGGLPALASFGWDSPYTLGPNAGFFVLDARSAGTRDLLRIWWNVHSGQYGLEHSYEQHALQWQLMHLHRFSKRVETLRLRTMEPNTTDAVVHLDHNAGTKTRLWLMAKAALRILVEGPSEAVGGERAQKKLRRLVPLFALARMHVRTKQRQAALSTVVRAASLHLNRTASAARAPLVTGIVPAFDATAAAARLLRLRSRHVPRALGGMPLSLINCSSDEDVASWQSWRRASRTVAAEPKRECKACHKDNGDEFTEGADATMTTIDSFALAGYGKLCASLGTTRAPKLPYAPLGALERCGEVTGSAPAATSAHLQYVASSGQIRTLGRLRTLRTRLRVLSPSCGFWSNCSGTRIVQAKGCWAQLQSDMHACGDSESALVLLLERAAKRARAKAAAASATSSAADPGAARPSWTSVDIGPAGPVPMAALTAAPGDRLCLARWRSHTEAGTNAVFANCPRAKASGFKAFRVEAFAWDLLPAPASAGRDAVRIVPRQAPHLCLSASPIHAES